MDGHPPSGSEVISGVSNASVSSIHAPIPSPVYTVRSQPIGLLSRSSSFSTGLKASTRQEDTGVHDEPRASPVNRMPLHRSESLPTFPPEKSSESTADRRRQSVTQEELSSLPPNPKHWRSSHLSLYLASTLSLPRPLRADITSFVISSSLSGRTFLYLREADLEEIGINILWRKALLDVRDVLKREANGGRTFWGSEGSAPMDKSDLQPKKRGRLAEDRRSGYESDATASEDEAATREEWKRSWRRLSLVHTVGRVRGIREAFESRQEKAKAKGEELNSPTTSDSQRPVPRTRHSSSESDWSSFGASLRHDTIGGEADFPRSTSYRSRLTLSPVESAAPSLADSADAHDDYTINDDATGAYSISAFDLSHHLDDFDLETDSIDQSTDFSRSPPRPHRYTCAPIPFLTTGSLVSIGVARASPSSLQDSFLPGRIDEQEGTSWPDSSRQAPQRLSSPFGDGYAQSKEGAEFIEAEDEDQLDTVRPVRSPQASTSSPTQSERQHDSLALASLFGVDVPTTMFVPARDQYDDDGTARGKKGSLVLIRKSQFVALQRRMQEVEEQLAEVLARSPVLPEDAAADEHNLDGSFAYKAEEIGSEQLSLLDRRMRELEAGSECAKRRSTSGSLSASISAAQLDRPVATESSAVTLPETPSTSPGRHASPSRQTTPMSTLSRRRSARRRRARLPSVDGEADADSEVEPPDSHAADRGAWDVGRSGWPHNRIDGWKQLSGYVVAASIGIGIVAGEVVTTRLLGLRRR
ncbi:hypothetical protein JCM10908_002461 [Rhodotorula pacifica]|uniref:uncharacterized protein n=1 Tax=Rhodotorula pacifica TaxID=1495444 RepID=UPI0031755E07